MLAFASTSISCFGARHRSPARLSLGFTESQESRCFPQFSLKMLWHCDSGLAPTVLTLLKSTHVLPVIADHYLKPPCSLWGKLILELWKKTEILFRKGFGEFEIWLLFILEWNVTFSNSWQMKILRKAAFRIDQNGSFWVGFHNLPEKSWNKSHFKIKKSERSKQILPPQNLKANWHDS